MRKYKVSVGDCGSRHWTFNENLHRIGGPAIINHTSKRWYLHGERHREDGPAIEWFGGASGANNWWYLKGVRLNEKEFLLKTSKPNLNRWGLWWPEGLGVGLIRSDKI